MVMSHQAIQVKPFKSVSKKLAGLLSDWWDRDGAWWENWLKVLIGTVLMPIALALLLIIFIPFLVGWTLRVLSAPLLYIYEYLLEGESADPEMKQEIWQGIFVWVILLLSVDWWNLLSTLVTYSWPFILLLGR